MEKLERLGCSKPVVGLVVPTGYVFNTDGSSIYMTLAALFVAQATNTNLSFSQQIAIFAVAMLTSKGASGVTGASFIALVGTLSVIPTIPVAGMALILGVDMFMSEARALVNVIGNGVTTIVISRTEGELDLVRVNAVLDGKSGEAEWKLWRGWLGLLASGRMSRPDRSSRATDALLRVPGLVTGPSIYIRRVEATPSRKVTQ
jgi:aerobic C4-dicarboxylate transport protein